MVTGDRLDRSRTSHSHAEANRRVGWGDRAGKGGVRESSCLVVFIGMLGVGVVIGFGVQVENGVGELSGNRTGRRTRVVRGTHGGSGKRAHSERMVPIGHHRDFGARHAGNLPPGAGGAKMLQERPGSRWATPAPGSFRQGSDTAWRSGDPNPQFHGGCFGV